MKKIFVKIIFIILRLLPTKLRIKIIYKYRCKRWPNLKEPKRLSEKLQLYKIEYKDEKMINLADKAKVPEYLKESGFSDIIIPKYGVYEDANDINFSELPNSFVIKLNNGSGYNIVVKDKEKADLEGIKNQIKKWLNFNPKKFGDEWIYYQIKNKIIIEQYLEIDDELGLIDYKYFCFDGVCNYMYVNINQYKGEVVDYLSFYDTNFNDINIYRTEFPPIPFKIYPPENHHKMLEIASKLSKGFPHVRIDLYNMKGKIYFGEFTFFTAKGYLNFSDDNFDFLLGSEFKYARSRKNN